MTTNRNMNTMLKTLLCLPMAVVLVSVALSGPASAKDGVPFKGVIEGTEDFTFLDPPVEGVNLRISGSGGGNATHLGRFTATWDGDITFGIPDSLVIHCFVAANGDEIWSVGLAAGTPPDPDQFVVGHFDIVGGTGRFDGATGSFTVERIVFNVSPPFTGLETLGSFDGTIILAH